MASGPDGWQWAVWCRKLERKRLAAKTRRQCSWHFKADLVGWMVINIVNIGVGEPFLYLMSWDKLCRFGLLYFHLYFFLLSFSLSLLFPVSISAYIWMKDP